MHESRGSWPHLSEVSPCCSLSARGQSSLHVSTSSVIPGPSFCAGTCGSCLHGALLYHLVSLQRHCMCCIPCRHQAAPAACMMHSCARMAAPGAATCAAASIGLHPRADVNCVMDRATLDKQLDAPPGQHQVRARNQCGGALIPLTDQQHTDLITVHLGDWLEQVATPCQLLCCAQACPRQAHLKLPKT